MVTREQCKSSALATVLLWLCITTAQAETTALSPVDDSTPSQQLLQTYFDTAGVCTTSEISKLQDNGDVVTIEINIEPDTRKGLAEVLEYDRDNWFSLHCPPETHEVWRQTQPPRDILVTGTLEDSEPFTLSCADYQRANKWGVRRVTIRDKIQAWLQEKLQN